MSAAHTVERGAFRGVALELRAKAMQSRRKLPVALALAYPKRLQPLSLSDKLGIAHRLLQLQKQGKLVVWIDRDEIRIASANEADPIRHSISWAQAAQIADNPERYLRDGRYVK